MSPEPFQLWLRHESRATERRTPLTPQDAGLLVQAGVAVTVEESPQRVFRDEDYAQAGCGIEPGGSWPGAPERAVILGLKELPDEPSELRHRHIFFGHAYKGQPGAEALLDRFRKGGGSLLDLEYLTDLSGRRLTAFGYWAGFIGAVVALLHHRDRLTVPLTPAGEQDWRRAIRPAPGDRPFDALVIGALGRCGRGACDALEAAGVTPTCWDLAETRALDRRLLLDHELLVNSVLSTRPVEPFLTDADLDADRYPGRRLRTVSDVACDVGSPCNVLPIYRSTTDWEAPVRRLRDGAPALDLIAIDNLPSLVPLEASTAFSAALVPELSALAGGSDGPGTPWGRCLARFDAEVRAPTAVGGPRDAQDTTVTNEGTDDHV
ncbi:saccharopine dehydrogenase [Streptacidiphilus sp. PB12-B1b]|uniref:saccharopine dehydrogenase n=1 Tax=Streptacidiphilus sp. PB12-B1b TaxID=2705012 RepID=UPI0015F93618|nr:saccharopine dehydrogenase [Streptacidiphilus sp. PB12-B1b]QMU78293.1 saccharopine dehydrogenase [Streptacidiphilus sp. PB12-B1b]